MNYREKEAVRYLGYGTHAVDEGTLLLIKSAFEELEQVAEKRAICRVFDLEIKEYPWIRVGNLDIESKHLYKNLMGCDKAAILGTTLGIGVDRLLKRASVRDMAYAVVVQACAAALLEEYCDEVQQELEMKINEENRYLRPRFSPGYGDFNIVYQKKILQLIDAAKQIGLSLTESCMMVPAKSVTALIGIGDTNLICHKAGCEACDKKDCLYRRDKI